MEKSRYLKQILRLATDIVPRTRLFACVVLIRMGKACPGLFGNRDKELWLLVNTCVVQLLMEKGQVGECEPEPQNTSTGGPEPGNLKPQPRNPGFRTRQGRRNAPIPILNPKP